ncbi:MAG TPA: CocE/NonD family hydrolase [Chitinophagales bacterium]|nr:CocE/NonD family hydrolase [Chitinophagales bacterium]
MKKLYTLVVFLVALNFSLSAQKPPNGTLDDITDFSTKLTVPFVMPDGVKLMTDVYLPRLRDSMRLSLGTINVLGSSVVTDTITLLHVGQQILYYDSMNGQPNPNPYQLPTIFTRTPYGKGDFDVLGGILPMLGYNYVLQDMRGRYTSEGVYFPMYSDSWNKNAYHSSGHVLDYLPPSDPKFSNKHEDGYNSIKDIENLSIPGLYDGMPHTNEKLNDGSIGMFGASALGNTQLQLGLAHHIPDSIPQLKCLMPIVATTEHYISTGYNNGVFRPGIVTGWLKGQIFSGTDDDLIPVDYDRQNSIHSSADYALPQSDSLNGVLVEYQQNKFDAATLSIDHFTAHRYVLPDGTLSPAGFYPNSAGRPDMDGSVAPVNQYGETVDSLGNPYPLTSLTYNRYRNMDVPVFHVTGWWDIFTEGQINTMNYTMDNIPAPNKDLQKIIIGPWAHQTIASRTTGDRTYPNNVTDLTKIDITNVSLSNVPLNQILSSDLITWFRFNLNYNTDRYVGEPKFIIREDHEWQLLGVANLFGGNDSIFVRVPSQDYIVPFIDMMNYLAGYQGLNGIQVELKIPAISQDFTTYESLPNNGPILPSFNGGTIQTIPYKDFTATPNVRYYVAGPDSAADAAAGYPNNANVGNYWNSCDRFPPSQHIQWQKMYLHQDGSFNFAAPTQDEGYDMYVDDPDDPILTVGGSNMIDHSPDGTRNTQGQMEMTDPTNDPYTMDRSGVIQFNSDPILDSFSIAGLPVCTLYAKTNPGGVSDGPTDTDWDMRICDVWPDGRVYFVQEGIVNARAREWARALVDSMGVPGAATYANGVEDPNDKNVAYSNINIGQIYEYVFKMLPIAYSWGAGHRIRVLINSTNYTKYQPNPNLPLNDGEFFRRNPGDGQSYIFQGEQMFPRVAVQRVHFSPENPTNIMFPVYNKDYTYTAVNQPVKPEFDVNVFPNPAHEKVQVFSNMPGQHQVDITDITGRVVLTGRFDDNIIFNTQGLGKGLYFATVSDINSPSKRITKKFVVE